MTKSEIVFNKFAKRGDDFSFKELGYGTAGGAIGAISTQAIDTVATVGQKEGIGIPESIRKINREAANRKVFGRRTNKLLKSMTKNVKSLKVPVQKLTTSKSLKLLKRYHSGLGAKILKIGPATGIAWATASYLKNKYGD